MRSEACYHTEQTGNTKQRRQKDKNMETVKYTNWNYNGGSRKRQVF